ncbi:response regulator [Asticcacaulis sp. W401b]|uniref:response regulator n=1 Tax=Asticcacaulis sp. W401b TaxID=3388666 RepID=UPI003970D796
MTTQRFKICVVEDNFTFRNALCLLAHTSEALRVADTFGAAEPFMARVEERCEAGLPLPWDLVLLDIDLPKANGIEALKGLVTCYPQARAVMLTVYEDHPTLLKAIRAGADGYLLKDAEPLRLLSSLEQACRHGAVFSPPLAAYVLGLLRARARETDDDAPLAGALSQKQVTVLKLLSQGHSYQAVADQMEVSIDAVRWHIRRIYAALRVSSAKEAVFIASKLGLFSR